MNKKVLLAIFGAGLLVNLFSAENDENSSRIGGAGYFELGFTPLNLEAIEKSVKEFEGREFDFDHNTFVTLGMGGYAGQKRTGVRTGLAISGGYKPTFSDEWHTPIDSLGESSTDSVIKLHMGFVQAGFLLEKSFALPSNFNVYLGGMLGGGALLAFAEFLPADNAFRSVNHDDDDDDAPYYYDDDDDEEDDDDNLKLAIATYWAFDVHSGVTYSLTNWMHIGMELSAMMQYSSSGFGNRTGSFFSVNPGAKIKIIFGTSV